MKTEMKELKETIEGSDTWILNEQLEVMCGLRLGYTTDSQSDAIILIQNEIKARRRGSK